MTEQPSVTTPGTTDRSASWILAITSILSVALMAQHPAAHGADIVTGIHDIASFAPTSRAVHGGLIALMVAIFCGYVSLSSHLGWRSGRVRAATIAYGVGVASHLGAALISGFILSSVAEKYVDVPASELVRVEPVLVLCHYANQAFALSGSIAMSVAIALWSWVLFSRGTFARILGGAGSLLGVTTIVALLSGHLRLHVHGMGAVVAAQAAWAVAVAIWLARERRGAD